MMRRFRSLIAGIAFCFLATRPSTAQFYVPIHQFDTPSDLRYPMSSVIFASDGNLYGTTTGGPGPLPGSGGIFMITSDQTLHVFHAFGGSDGSNPESGPMQASDAKLYGTTHDGGSSDLGTIYQVDLLGSFSTLYSFAGPDGANPAASLLEFGTQVFYGTTSAGGSSSSCAGGCGTVFKVDSSGNLTTLHSFQGNDGQGPGSELMIGVGGPLYGTTNQGGRFGYGTIYRFEPASATFQTVYDFTGAYDGGHPRAGLVQGNDGNLYGTTTSGGSLQHGTVFRLGPTGVATLHSFDSDGYAPIGSLITDTGRSLYGTTSAGPGPDNLGTIFKMNLYGDIQTLDSLAFDSGSQPMASLMQSSAGDLYGTAYEGGDGTGFGVVFEVEMPVATYLIAPSSGPADIGIPISVAGAGYENGLTLMIGPNPADNVQVLGSEQIDATTPLLPAGTLNDVVVHNPDGSQVTLLKAYLADFDDTPFYPFSDFVRTIFRNGITSGCAPGLFCPADPVTRAQMAVFLLKGAHGRAYLPPTCAGIFQDVACTPVPAFAVDWIEELYNEGITGGCSTNPLSYCPSDPVTRDQMAVFLLKAKHGRDYTPPPCDGVFSDVTCPGPFADWIEALYFEGITAGCEQGQTFYCPGSPVSRDQMAVFLTKTFVLP